MSPSLTLYRSLLGLLAAALSVSATLLTDANEFNQIAFDYIVVGAGTAGLALAARLSENASVLVGVIEAGQYLPGDILIDTPEFLSETLGNPKYDWAMSTIPQPDLNNRTVLSSRGKVVGGSSALNFMIYDRASQDDLNAWENNLGNDGWGWDDILPYLMKQESAPGLTAADQANFPGASSELLEDEISLRDSYEGTSGPIHPGYNTFYGGNITAPLVASFNNIGVATNPMPDYGNPVGVYNFLVSVDPVLGVRSYAANTYWADNANRTNFVLLTGAQATSVAWSQYKTSDGLLQATGVNYVSGGNSYNVRANKEVIISAGNLQSPQLLELSGIGNPDILGAVNIPTLVDLPGVGENYQDHLFVIASVVLQEGHQTLDELNYNATFFDEEQALYNETKTGLLTWAPGTIAFVPLQTTLDSADFATAAADANTAVNSASTPLEQAQFAIQEYWINNGSQGQTEFILGIEAGFTPTRPSGAYADSNFISILVVGEHPFSRGTVHINSSDPLTYPLINPNYLSEQYDVDVLVGGLKFMRTLFETEPFASIVAEQWDPSPDIQTDEELEAYVRSYATTIWHGIGTAALAPRDLGGVVDTSLTVYGTSNLRVADSSIVPLHMTAHVQTISYAIGERAADIIKATW